MKLRRLLKAALGSIGRNRLRSLLTALGIVIGVAAVIVMVALGRGAQLRIEREISALGRNMLTVFSGASMFGGVSRGVGSMPTLTLADADRLREDATLLAYVSPSVRTGAQAVAGGTNWPTSVYGVMPDYLDVREWKVAEGETFSDREGRAGAKVALLGATVARELFGESSPIGERVRIGSVPFRVIGVLSTKGVSGFGADQDDVVIAPIGAVLGRLTRPNAPIQLNLSVAAFDRMKDAEAEAREILRLSHRLGEAEEDDFTIRSQADLTSAATATTETLTLLLGGVAAVSLLVGGIGIMNIMLVSVTERTREIGIRLAVGARGRDILLQFLLEALALTVGGALLGILLGLGAARLFELGGRFQTAPEPGSILIATVVAVATGLLFGIAPARRAANLDPIEALRHE
ncbi:MAG: FtsX-like permease family protein [Acidobacteria bacterium]|nr:FtsX-like permease family protein [Acidobacteriota bacterium]